MTESNMNSAPWLTIIGIGEGGMDDLGDLAWSLLVNAEVILGGERHLAMVPDELSSKAKRMTWPSPLSLVYDQLKKLRGTPVVILASGDPMEFGIAGSLTRHFDWHEMRVLPSPSSFSLAASILGWPLDKVVRLTIHGRNPAALVPHLMPGARLLILSKDGTSPALVARLLCERGLDKASVTVLEHLGGEKEKVIESTAKLLDDSGDDLKFADLNLLAVSLPERFDGWLPAVPGLPDEAFEHDGKMTKRDIRASALAKLAPHPGALLWDVGTGCGSIAIEWMRAHPSCMAIGVEPQEKRRAFAQHNADMLGVPKLRLLNGTAPDSLRGEPHPDAVFVGGGLSADVINFCMRSLKPGGRLVAHAVTLGSEKLLLEMFERNGGELTRLSIAKAEAVGPYYGWKTAMPVTQWAFVKDDGL
ncbi:precorrin-6Y C5,15-methyltransferase (decarboxylating) [Cohaesibacter sp. ES.047]|uniref:precorrin-6y C5,15-methyltransferase (decarboxylating) subunit CbiE n=1 Tax=Cohaesibacter sp. ES.047 TaxID=1798205 RepID=UPI000BC0F0A6|nr:precorrin-6y C5,15-methyltransferase (decarboxylating) subunit CbiE [Cohaesibacter sp. ES.047]SNY93554.1 precorrin-6Y C5,15-methyltransferase (decarboxylating) [Cohaesibacter sp. ES.047]